MSKLVSYCIQQVRKHDYKHYICLINLPAGVREAAFAIRAFNVETAMVKDSSKQRDIAKVRLAWWRDAVDSLYKPSSSSFDHPVVKALGAAIKDYKLSKHWFSRILDARAADLDMNTPPLTISQLEQYAESTASAMLYLTLEAAGVRDTKADHAASHTGKASGLALLLNAAPFHCSQRESYIPLEVASKHGVVDEQLYSGLFDERVSAAVFDIASVAHSHLQKARELKPSIPKPAARVLLPAVPADEFLSKLQATGFNPFDPVLQRGVGGVQPLWMLLKLKWYSIKGLY